MVQQVNADSSPPSLRQDLLHPTDPPPREQCETGRTRHCDEAHAERKHVGPVLSWLQHGTRWIRGIDERLHHASHRVARMESGGPAGPRALHTEMDPIPGSLGSILEVPVGDQRYRTSPTSSTPGAGLYMDFARGDLGGDRRPGCTCGSEPPLAHSHHQKERPDHEDHSSRTTEHQPECEVPASGWTILSHEFRVAMQVERSAEGAAPRARPKAVTASPAFA